MRTLKDTCGLSVNITLRAEFNPVKARTWGYRPKDQPTSDVLLVLVHRSIRPMSSAEIPRRTRSPLVIWILYTGGS